MILLKKNKSSKEIWFYIVCYSAFVELIGLTGHLWIRNYESKFSNANKELRIEDRFKQVLKRSSTKLIIRNAWGLLPSGNKR
jgi:hypothetical protein